MNNNELQQRLVAFHASLPLDKQQEFRRILDDFASYYFEVGEVFKQVVIELIPSKVSQQLADAALHTSETYDENLKNMTFSYKPTTKSKTGDPLSELLVNMTDEQRASLQAKLEAKK